MSDTNSEGVGQMRAIGAGSVGVGACGGQHIGRALSVAQQLYAWGSLGLLLCMSGAVINDLQALLLPPPPPPSVCPAEVTAATACSDNGQAKDGQAQSTYAGRRETRAIFLLQNTLLQGSM